MGSGKTLEFKVFSDMKRDGRLLQTVGPRNSFYAWSLSPDKKRIATQRPMKANLSPPDENAYALAWSPDDRSIAYLSF